MLVRAGFPAAINCKSRQTRKGAAVAVISGAGSWLARTLIYLYYYENLCWFFIIILLGTLTMNDLNI